MEATTRNGFKLLILFLFASATTVLFTETSTAVEISGFGDFYYEIQQENTLGQNFEIGQVELDLETAIEDKIVISAAIAYDSREETFGLGAFTVDFYLFGSEGGHFRPLSGIDHSGIMLGQFDVPFGIDWHVYPSIDRKLVSGPLVVENTHDFWNDYGVQAYIETKLVNGVVYWTNGFGYEVTDTSGNPVDVEMKMASGGRIGVNPHKMIDFGGSYAGFFDHDNNLDMSLLGVDLQLSYKGFSLKGEYIVHQLGLAGDDALTNSGFYGQVKYDFSEFFLVGRHGRFSRDEESADDLSRTSAGAGWVVKEGCELRFEYQVNSEDNDDVTFLQLVVGF